MSDSKCFCHFNGFEVKDAKARTDIAAFQDGLESTNEYIAKVDDRVRGIIACDDATEGNIELIDIRHGINGFNYPTAGDAVRNQIANIDKYFKSYNLFKLGTENHNFKLALEDQVVGAPLSFLVGDKADGYCVGGFNSQINTMQEVKPGTWYTSNALDFAFLDENELFISSVSFEGGTNTFQTPDGCVSIVYDWNPARTLTKDIFLCEGQGLSDYSAELSEQVQLSDKHYKPILDHMSGSYLNALKGSASGDIVAIKDVSPLPHTVLVKASGGGVGDELTKTVEVTEPMQEVLLDTPAESVRVVVRGGAYCVGGLVPMVDGDDLTVSNMKDELALWPTWSYGEAPGNYDLVYTVSGNTLSWSGTKYYELDGVIEQSEDISGSVELSTSGQKIIGFCQIYEVYEDNPNAEYPEYDELNMTVEVYESVPSVEVKVYGKNLLPSNFADLSTWSGSYFYFDLPVGNYTFTFELNPPDDMKSYGYLYVYKSNDNWATKTYVNSWGNPVTGDYVTKKFTFAVEEGYQYAFWMYALADKIQYYSDFQLEVGTSGTGYEPYIEPKTYTVTANGTAIPSIYPSMTFIPEKDGVELSVEYNRDINKAFAELQAALISMGGNV